MSKEWVVYDSLQEQTNYLLYEHKKFFSGHPSKKSYRTHIKKLQDEVDRLEEQEKKLTKFILQNSGDFTGDHACVQCHPYSDLIYEGFECGLHLSRRLQSEAAPEEE